MTHSIGRPSVLRAHTEYTEECHGRFDESVDIVCQPDDADDDADDAQTGYEQKQEHRLKQPTGRRLW